MTTSSLMFFAVFVVSSSAFAGGVMDNANNLPSRPASDASPKVDQAAMPPTSMVASAHSLLIRDDLETGYRGKYPDRALRIVSPARRHADVALLVVGALLGSFRPLVSKEDYTGEVVAAMPHPGGRVLRSELKPVIDEWLELNGLDKVFSQALWVRQDRFQLVFRNLDDDPTIYDLTIEATISRKLDGAGVFASPEAFTCTWKSDPKASITLREWQADGYALVTAASTEFVEACVAQARVQTGDLMMQKPGSVEAPIVEPLAH